MSEIPLAVTSGIFSGLTGKLDILIIEVEHKFVILLATSEVSAAFSLSHSSTRAPSVSLCPSSTVTFKVGRLLLVTYNQSDRAVCVTLTETTEWSSRMNSESL